MARVLLIAASMEHADDIQRHLAGHDYSNIEFRYPSNISNREETLLALYDDCCDVIREENIIAILSLHREVALVHAALVKKFPDIRGPSFESVYIVVNRYYNKRYVSADFTSRFTLLDVQDLSTETILATIDESCGVTRLSDVFSTERALAKSFAPLPIGRHNRKITELSLSQVKTSFSENAARLRPIISNFLPTGVYPLCNDEVCIVEDEREPLCNCSTHYVEGCVSSDGFVPWAISDVENGPSVSVSELTCTCVSVPTRLSLTDQMLIWAVFREAVQKLAVRGYVDQFVSGTITLCGDDTVQIIDMSPCANRSNRSLYRHTFINGDNVLAQINVSIGEVISTPRLLPQRHALRARLMATDNTTASQCVGDIIDVKKARTISSVEMFARAGTIISNSKDGGLHIADILARESSYNDCMVKLQGTLVDIVRSLKQQDDQFIQVDVLEPSAQRQDSQSPSLSSAGDSVSDEITNAGWQEIAVSPENKTPEISPSMSPGDQTGQLDTQESNTEEQNVVKSTNENDPIMKNNSDTKHLIASQRRSLTIIPTSSSVETSTDMMSNAIGDEKTKSSGYLSDSGHKMQPMPTVFKPVDLHQDKMTNLRTVVPGKPGLASRSRTKPAMRVVDSEPLKRK